MNTDMPAFTAFALESCRPPQHSAAQSQTLTLQLAIATIHSLCDPMGGSVSSKPVQCSGAATLRAAVVPASGPGLTITF